MKKILCIVFSLNCLFNPAQLCASLPTYAAQYTVRWHGIKVGVASHELTQQKNRYFFKVCAKSTVPFVNHNFCEKSQGYVKTSLPKPMHYSSHYAGQKKGRDIQLTFNYKDRKITRKPRKKSWALVDNIQDRISHQLVLMNDLKNGKKQLEYEVLDGHKLRHYQFKTEGFETLKTPLGHLKTIKLSRRAKNRYTQLWYAPKLNHVLVKAIHEKNGKVQGTALIHAILR